jgi:hypothetical protein
VVRRVGPFCSFGPCVDAPGNASDFFHFGDEQCGRVPSCVRPHSAALQHRRPLWIVRGSGPNRLAVFKTLGPKLVFPIPSFSTFCVEGRAGRGGRRSIHPAVRDGAGGVGRGSIQIVDGHVAGEMMTLPLEMRVRVDRFFRAIVRRKASWKRSVSHVPGTSLCHC